MGQTLEKMGQAIDAREAESKSGPPTLEQVAAQIQSGQLRNIIVMAGAGISCSAGIPDFRTPGTGLYDNLQKYNLPTPQSIFTLDYFRENPQPFFTLVKDLYPGKFKPTKAHAFIKLLADRKVLLRCYTQNIDGLEEIAGVPKHLIMQAHGGFGEPFCIDCKAPQDAEMFKQSCMAGKVYTCVACHGLVKPPIVFFGESLPADFGTCVAKDFPKCDCLIVMGTSLSVFPFAGLIDMVPKHAIRVLINREVCGSGFLFGQAENTRDVLVQTDCDTGVQKLADIIDPLWFK